MLTLWMQVGHEEGFELSYPLTPRPVEVRRILILMLLCMISSSCNVDARNAGGTRRRRVRAELPGDPSPEVCRILILMLLCMISSSRNVDARDAGGTRTVTKKKGSS